MMDQLNQLLGESGGALAILGGTAVMLAVFIGAAWSLFGQDRAVNRFAPTEVDDRRLPANLRREVRREDDGVDRFLLPQAKSERFQIQRLLIRAGFAGPGALRNFYLTRVGLAGGGMALGLLASSTLLPKTAGGPLGGPLTTTIVLVLVAIALGFYAPLAVVRWRAAARQQQIRRGFPDALDLLQVMMQAGLGLDAAMQRIGEELGRSCPPLAHEVNVLALELRAGKTRELALQDFAGRIDIDYVRAFTVVLNQSLRFGTSVSAALEVFSADMRNARMMAAEEKANKLPVQMSVVLVLFMLPAVMAVALGPVIIRAVRVILPTLT